MAFTTNPRIEVICVGSELLSGKVNTHAAYLGDKCDEIGLRVAREHTVPDNIQLMKETFHESWKRSDVVLSCGGLGPTFDDITREVWSTVTKRKLVLNPALVQNIREKFRSRGLVMPPMNRRQANVLKGADVIPNPNGTAPGQWLQINNKVLVLLPGPARELLPMFEQSVLPRLRRIFSQGQSIRKSFHLVGVTESLIDQRIRPLINKTSVQGCQVTYGILASNSIITVKFRVDGRDIPQLRSVAANLSKKFKKVLGEHLFGEEHDRLEQVIGQRLLDQHKTLAVAESCTGGLVAKMITDQPGASEYFREGIVTYSNTSKMKRLDVSPRTLSRFGAVSKETAREMALGLKKKSGATHTLSITGIAGPDGGTAQKPVGLIYIGCAGPKRTLVKEFRFQGDRAWIRHRAALMALETLRRELR